MIKTGLSVKMLEGKWGLPAFTWWCCCRAGRSSPWRTPSARVSWPLASASGGRFQWKTSRCGCRCSSPWEGKWRRIDESCWMTAVFLRVSPKFLKAAISQFIFLPKLCILKGESLRQHLSFISYIETVKIKMFTVCSLIKVYQLTAFNRLLIVIFLASSST